MANKYPDGFTTVGKSPEYKVLFNRQPVYVMRKVQGAEGKTWQICTLEGKPVLGAATAMDAVGPKVLEELHKLGEAPALREPGEPVEAVAPKGTKKLKKKADAAA